MVDGTREMSMKINLAIREPKLSARPEIPLRC